jgi:diaminopimelate decarboxylase
MPVSDLAETGHGYAVARENFSVEGGHLHIGGLQLAALVRDIGSPAYFYDGDVIRRTYRGLAEALRGFAHLHYSIKANPAPAIVRLLLSEGAGVEIASGGEYRAARAAGARPDQIIFAGPGKRSVEIEEVISGGVGEIHLEGYHEIDRIAGIARRLGRRLKAALRINPVATAQAGAMRMGGKPTAFGFDEECLADAVTAVTKVPEIDLVGIHVYAGTQILDVDALVRQWRHAIHLAAQVASLHAKPLETIDLGGGLGIPYYAGEKPLDLTRLTADVAALSRDIRANPLLAGARVIVEPGRYLVGPAGVYVAEVNAVKTSRGTRFIVTDGGMHHHLAASGNLGQIIKRDYPIVAPARMSETAVAPATVVGPLCTPLDTLAREALLPQLDVGDLIAVLQSGAYGLTASPAGFLSHPPPAEVLVESGSFTVL